MSALQLTPPRKFSHIAVLDLLRAGCILYIIGFWHLFNYTYAFPAYENPVTYRLTVTVLGLFTLLSGYLIGHKNISLTRPELLGFYRQRLLRIYPPYLLALLVFLVLKIATLAPVLKSAVLLSLLWGPPPYTLWYMVMLLSFYILAPVLIALRGNLAHFLGLCAGLMAAMLTLFTFNHSMDPRMVLYFPAFATGIMLAGRDLSQTSPRTIVILGLAASAAVMLSVFDSSKVESSLLSIPLALLVPSALMLVALRYARNWGNHRLIGLIAYASFFAYLFHRPIYKVMTFVYMPSSHSAQVAYLLGACLPMALIGAWIGQTVYDQLLKRA